MKGALKELLDNVDGLFRFIDSEETGQIWGVQHGEYFELFEKAFLLIRLKVYLSIAIISLEVDFFFEGFDRDLGFVLETQGTIYACSDAFADPLYCLVLLMELFLNDILFLQHRRESLQLFYSVQTIFLVLNDEEGDSLRLGGFEWWELEGNP